MKSIVENAPKKSGATGPKAQSMREEIRHLWTRLQTMLPSPGESSLRLGFVSTYPGEGTTTMAANFALFLGEQGLGVCLVECNLRQPALAEHFDVPATPGISDVLSGTAKIEEALRPSVGPGVALLPGGSVPRDVYGVFGRGGMTRVHEELAGLSDVRILDIPPLASAPEAGTILRELDGVVLVVRSHRTRQESVEKSVATLSELGVPCSVRCSTGSPTTCPLSSND